MEINWILVPVRNGVGYTKEAVKTFLKQDIGNVKVLLIDNDSRDGTAEWARSQHPMVITVGRKPALGVAASWNFGLKLLMDTLDVKRVLVVNNDVKLSLDTYRLLDEDGGEFVTAVGVDTEEQLTAGNVKGRRPHPDFSCFLIRKKVIEKVGWFDEGYAGGYVEDADYHLRMHRAGVKAESLGIPFLHYASGTLKCATKAEQERICELAEMNRKRFKELYGVAQGSAEYYDLFGSNSTP
jgi:GT2 family glycosyltransferase